MKLLKVHTYYDYSDEDLKFMPNVSPGGDDTVYFYVNNDLVMHGDYYHNKIDEKIEGFIGALKFLGIDFTEDDSLHLPSDTNEPGAVWEGKYVVARADCSACGLPVIACGCEAT